MRGLFSITKEALSKPIRLRCRTTSANRVEVASGSYCRIGPPSCYSMLVSVRRRETEFSYSSYDIYFKPATGREFKKLYDVRTRSSLKLQYESQRGL